MLWASGAPVDGSSPRSSSVLGANNGLPPAGGRPDYPYSAALQHSDVIWTEETVARPFEVGPDVMVPGSNMPLQRMPNAADRAVLVAYLERITTPGGG